MVGFLAANIGTIAVGVVVFGAAAAIAIRLVQNHRRGKPSCGCADCGGCGGCGGSRSPDLRIVPVADSSRPARPD